MTDAPQSEHADLKERVHEYFAGSEPEKLFRRMMLVSVTVHAVLCGLVFSGVLSGSMSEKTRFLSHAVEVSLVDLPEPATLAERAPKPAPSKAPVVETPPAKPEAAPAPKAVSVAATPAPSAKPFAKVPATTAAPDGLYLKRKEAEAERKRRLEREILGEEDTSRVSEREKLRAALAALKQQGVPETQEAAPAAESSARSVEEIEQQLTSAARAQSALETADKVALRREVEYRAHVIKQVQSRWRVPANLSRRRELATVIRFRIDADGTVLSAALEQSSGERAFDDAVLRAAKEVKTLDTPPQEFPRNFLVKFNNTEG